MLGLASLICTSWACSSPEPDAPQSVLPGTPLQPGDELEYKLFPTTKLLDDEAANAITPPDTNGTIRIPASLASLANLARGNVLLAYQTNRFPQGLLRLVSKVEQEGDTKVVYTVVAPVELAFQKLHVKATRRIDDFAGQSVTWVRPDLKPLASGKAHAKEAVDFYLFNGDNDISTKGDQLHVHGELGGGYEYLFGIDFDWDEITEIPKKIVDCVLDSCNVKDLLPELKAGIKIEADANTNLWIEGAASYNYKKNYTLAKIDPSPKVGVGPLLFDVDLSVIAEISGSASAQFSLATEAEFGTGAELSFSTKTGAKYVEPYETHSFTPPTIEVGLHANARVQVGSKLALLLYGAVGPTASLYAVAEVAADRAKTPCYSATIGAGITLGLELGINFPAIGYIDLASTSKSFDLFKKQVATGGCSAPPHTNTLPPGSGADAEMLLSPQYTPWSKTWDGIANSYAYSLGSLQSTHALRAIDGNAIITGSTLGPISKVDREGTLLWSRKISDAAYPTETGPEKIPLIVTHTAPATDATMIAITQPYGFVKVGQSGGVAWGKRFDLKPGKSIGANGNSTEGHTLTSIIPDGSGGFFLSGTYNAPGEEEQPVLGLILHIDENGEIIWSKTVSAEDGHWLYPVTLDRLENTIVISGMRYNNKPIERSTFVLRLGTDGSLQGSSILACAELDEQMQPTTSTVTHDGNLVFAGFLGPYYRGFLLGMNPDGEVTWGRMPWANSALSYLRINSLTELPTTGFVATANYTDGYGPSSLAVLGLDVLGNIQWLKQFVTPGAESGFSAALPTDQGGIFTAARVAKDTNTSTLWALTPFAKDGDIQFQSNTVNTATPKYANDDCTPQTSKLTVKIADIDVKMAPMQLVVEDVSPTMKTQAP